MPDDTFQRVAMRLSRHAILRARQRHIPLIGKRVTQDTRVIDATNDPLADAANIAFSGERSARQAMLDDGRILDYAADDSLVEVEILSPSQGVDLTGIPRDSDVAAALLGLGFPTVDALSQPPHGRG